MRIAIPGMAAFGLMTIQALAQSPDPNNGPELSCTMCEGAYGEDFS